MSWQHWQLRSGAPRYLSAEERSALEASFEKHRTALSMVADQMNTAVFALALPDELLVDIFRRYIAAWRETHRHEMDGTLDNESKRPVDLTHSNAELYGWIILTHVCRRWRQVALRTPSFWTRIRVSTPQLVRTFLERSENMALDVEGALIVTPQMSRDTLEAWQLVFGQSHRIRTLQLSYSFVEGRKAPEQAIRRIQFGSPWLPKLKSLLLYLDTTYIWDCTLPPVLVTSKSQSTLETLQAYNVEFHTIRELFTPRLLHLELHNAERGCTTVDELRLHWETTLNALKSLPQLQTLKLMSSLPYSAAVPDTIDEPPLNLNEPVTLPHLSLLQTSSRHRLTPVATLIRHLSFPTLTALSICMHISLESNVRLLASTLVAKAYAAENALPPSPLRTVSIYTQKFGTWTTIDNPVTLTAWTQRLPPPSDTGSDVSPTPSAPDSFLFEARLSKYDTRPKLILESIVKPLPMESVECVYLTLHDTTSDDLLGVVLREAFAQAIKVDTLVIRQDWALDWLPDALWYPKDGGPVFPKLTALYFSEVSFPPLGTDHEWGAIPMMERRNQWWKNLEVALRLRLEEGRKLAKIVVAKSRHVYQENIDMLEQCAHEVVWDGLTGDEEKAEYWAWARSDCEESG